jgi:hypothetical protein
MKPPSGALGGMIRRMPFRTIIEPFQIHSVKPLRMTTAG